MRVHFKLDSGLICEPDYIDYEGYTVTPIEQREHIEYPLCQVTFSPGGEVLILRESIGQSFLDDIQDHRTICTSRVIPALMMLPYDGAVVSSHTLAKKGCSGHLTLSVYNGCLPQNNRPVPAVPTEFITFMESLPSQD